MSLPDVVVIDYGMGNLLSVRRGLEHCGAKVTISSEPEIILAASHVVLPGVGAYACAMEALHHKDMYKVICAVAQQGTPLLGICLGMQLLLTESEEFGLTQGLDLIPGSVIAVPNRSSIGQLQKVPHVGWGALTYCENRNSWDGTILENIKCDESAYFVHSFMSVPIEPEYSIAECKYGGQSVIAVIKRDNIYGCQFHPEKSGEVGLKILRNFLLLPPRNNFTNISSSNL